MVWDKALDHILLVDHYDYQLFHHQLLYVLLLFSFVKRPFTRPFMKEMSNKIIFSSHQIKYFRTKRWLPGQPGQPPCVRACVPLVVRLAVVSEIIKYLKISFAIIYFPTRAYHIKKRM